MVLIPVLCPHCHSDQVIKGGKTKAGQQRYKCQRSYWIPGSWHVRMVYTDAIPFYDP